MRLLVPFLLLIFCTCTKMQAQTPKSLLWELSGNGLAKPSYIFGTMHQICAEDYFWTDTMRKYFHRSEKVSFEIDLDNPFLIFSTLKSMRSTDGRTIQDLFMPADFVKLSRYFKVANGIDIKYFNEVKPAVLLMLLETGYTFCAEMKSYETEIKAEAEKFKKPILGLETVAEQFAAVSNASDAEVVKYVMEIVDGKYMNDVSHKMAFSRISALYKKQDIQSLYELILEDTTALFDKNEMVLDFRNKNWIPKIEEWSKSHAVFYAVGAGHLAGENGIINLLKKAGYTLKPIYSEAIDFD